MIRVNVAQAAENEPPIKRVFRDLCLPYALPKVFKIGEVLLFFGMGQGAFLFVVILGRRNAISVNFGVDLTSALSEGLGFASHVNGTFRKNGIGKIVKHRFSGVGDPADDVGCFPIHQRQTGEDPTKPTNGHTDRVQRGGGGVKSLVLGLEAQCFRERGPFKVAERDPVFHRMFRGFPGHVITPSLADQVICADERNVCR